MASGISSPGAGAATVVTPTTSTDPTKTMDTSAPLTKPEVGRFYHGLSADEITVRMPTGDVFLRDLMRKHKSTGGGCYPVACWRGAILQHVGADIAGGQDWVEVMDTATEELLR